MLAGDPKVQLASGASHAMSYVVTPKEAIATWPYQQEDPTHGPNMDATEVWGILEEIAKAREYNAPTIMGGYVDPQRKKAQ